MQALSGSNALRPQAQSNAAAQRTDLEGSGCPNLTGCQKVRGGNPTEQISTTIVMKPGTQSYGDIEKFAQANGLKVTSSDPESHMVKLSGTAAQYQKAFGTEIAEYKDAKGSQFRAYEGKLSMPKALAGQVEGVLGLYNRAVASPRNTGIKIMPKDMPATGFTGAQVGAAMNFPKGLDGTGQTISIIELGGALNTGDLATYFKNLGINQPKFNIIPVDGATPTSDGADGADGEVMLDAEVAGAVAPGATINVYFAPNSEQGFVDAVAQATKDNPQHNTTSISWGSSEDNTGLWTADAKNAFNTVLQDAANHGNNVYVASGDNGSDDGMGDGGKHVDFPSSSPWTISTGGTLLKTDANGARSSEVGWGTPDSQNGSSGGGVSDFFAMPDYQKNAGIPAPATAGAGGRGVPDVAGNAAPESGYNVLVDGTTAQIGGTSAVAPLYAGLTAVLAQGNGGSVPFLNPIFYANPGAFTDITADSNGAWTAGPGWDAVTGLGSADGSKLLDAIKAASTHKA